MLTSLKSSFFLFFLLTATFTTAQSWDWLNQAGGLKSDKGSTIAVDHEGNIFFTGYYNEQADFGPFNTGFSYQKSKETFIAKMDAQGNYLWVRNATNYYDDRGLGLCLDPQGNVYVTGTCWGGLVWGSLNVYNPSQYTDQIYVTKLDTYGNEIWMKNAGVEAGSGWYNDDHGQDMVSDSQGNLFITGFLSNNDVVPNTAFFDGIQIPMAPNDSVAFLAKLSNDGVWQWVETFGGIYGHFTFGRDNGIGIDDEDNVYVVGGFKGVSTFGTTTLTSTLFPSYVNSWSIYSSDIFVVKYDNDGNFQFVEQVADSLDARADQITYGNDGHMYVTGEFRSEVLFGTDDLNNYGSPGDKDIFVSKMNKDGVWAWATKAGSKKSGDRGIGICANDNGNIFVAGQYRGQAKFGEIEVDAGPDSTQLFVAMINSSGKWQWVLEGGGPFNDRAASIDVDGCDVYVTGFFKNSMVTDTAELTLTSSGGNDIFIGKIVDACEGQSPPPPTEEEDEEDVFNFQSTNVFTPNEDGSNDLLYLCKDCNVKGYLVIVNRWGNIVFETNDISQPWDGKSQSGKSVQDGTYFYHMDVEFKNGTSETKDGFITLVN